MRLAMLTKRRDFLAAKSGPQTAAYGCSGFLLQARRRKPAEGDGVDAEGPRFGITVSNHTVRREIMARAAKRLPNEAKTGARGRRGPVSVLRNRMRRRLREALREVAPGAAQAGVDYVIIGRPAVLTLPFEILLKDLEKSFQKVHRRIIPTGEPLP